MPIGRLPAAGAWVTAILGLTPTLADAGMERQLKRALQEARCIPASVKEIQASPRRTVYSVTCRGGTPRQFTAICTVTGCFMDAHSEHRDVDELDD